MLESQLTKRAISPGAEKWLFEPIQIHELGFVELVSYDGDDHTIANAARHSYGKGTRSVSDDTILIRYLRRLWHTSPFEQCSLTFQMKLPLFVQGQVVRHRTASLNQESFRYSQAGDEFYIPSNPGQQSVTNKQGTTTGTYTQQETDELRVILADACQESYDTYEGLLQEYNLSREQARIILPAGTYTRTVWKMDLHNLMHFMRLRLHPHAQGEVRDYAEAISRVCKDAFPIAYQAFEDYVLNTVTLTAKDIQAIQALGSFRLSPLWLHSEPSTLDSIIPNKREQGEFLDKMKLIFNGPGSGD